MRIQLGIIVMMGVLGVVAAAPAQAGAISLGGGWQANWDGSLDPYVGIEVLDITDSAIFIRKSAQFIQGPVNGIFPSVPIVFQQVDASVIQYIVIEEESILNSTGVAWTDFHMDLLDHGDAAFVFRDGVSGGLVPMMGFSVSPFTQSVFTNPQRLDIWGGVVDPGQVWNPGAGPDGGQLWIGVVSAPAGTPGALFTLKETPTPEPASLVLLALGAWAVVRRPKR